MADMTVQELAALRELTNDKHAGKWSENTALWAIVIVLIVLALMWYINRVGADKADLAASVQSATSRISAVEVATKAQGDDIKDLNKVVSSTTQAQADFQYTAGEQIAMLNRATFVPRGGRSCGGDGQARFVKRTNYCVDDQSLQEIDTCG